MIGFNLLFSRERGGEKCHGSSSFAFRCLDDNDEQNDNEHSLYGLKGWRIQLPNLLPASKWILLVDPFLEIPCTYLMIN